MINPQDKAYLSIAGRAEVIDDNAIAKRIWKKVDDVWWTGPADANLRVLRLDPHFAELWDGLTSSVVARHEFMKALNTGKKPNLGENRKVTVQMD